MWRPRVWNASSASRFGVGMTRCLEVGMNGLRSHVRNANLAGRLVDAEPARAAVRGRFSPKGCCGGPDERLPVI